MAPLSGHYQPEHLFALEQAVMRYDFYQQRVHDCDMQIEALIKTLNSDCCVPTVPLPKPRHKTRQPNQLNFDVRKELYQLVGTDGGHRFDSDLWHFYGIGPYRVLLLVSEVSTDSRKWSSVKHFTS